MEEYRGFQYSSKPKQDDETFRMFMVQDHVHLSWYHQFDAEDELDFAHAIPLRIVSIDWERGLLPEDPPRIKISGNSKSLAGFVDVIQWLDSVVDINRKNEPTIKEVVAHLREMGLVDCSLEGVAERIKISGAK